MIRKWCEGAGDSLAHGFAAESIYADLLILGRPAGPDGAARRPPDSSNWWHGIAARLHVREPSSRVAAALVTLAGEERADLLVMGCYGHGGGAGADGALTARRALRHRRWPGWRWTRR